MLFCCLLFPTQAEDLTQNGALMLSLGKAETQGCMEGHAGALGLARCFSSSSLVSMYVCCVHVLSSLGMCTCVYWSHECV